MLRCDPKQPIFDLCSPSLTGLGLEIIRTINILKAAFKSGFHCRLWTFHPLIFNDSCFEIIPLQQSWLPLLPAATQTVGAIWMPSSHLNGPYVCTHSVDEAINRGFRLLKEPKIFDRKGALPAFVNEVAENLFPRSGFTRCVGPGWGLYPADELTAEEVPPIILNFIGAHGQEKGSSNVLIVMDSANNIARAFPAYHFYLLLHARILSGQEVSSRAQNLTLLMHLDEDPRVSRLLHRSAKVITVEGGLAHSAIERECSVTLLGHKDWLNKIDYLYSPENFFRKTYLLNFSEIELTKAVIGVISSEF